MSHLVVLLDSAVGPGSSEYDIERAVLADVAEVKPMHVYDEREFAEIAGEIDGCIVSSNTRISHLSLSRMRRGTVLVRNGVGFDNVDVAEATRLGILVCNVPDYGTEEVADHTIALMLALLRGLAGALADVAAGNWNWRVCAANRRLRELSLGIIGCGRIGTAVALRAKAFGLQIGFYDPYVSAGYEKALGVGRLSDLNSLLEQSDVVSVHVPLTAETFHLIAATELARMKPGSFLINTARGPVVDERALAEGLRSGPLAGAALDVIENEPSVGEELRLQRKCLITPHCAFYSQQSVTELRRKAAMIIHDVLNGKPARNVVNG
jgi:lactate dehydrogenase-like 2-hydroxyacid dehydrogenase